jgi:hypothetical protein
MNYTYQVQRYDPSSTDWKPTSKARHATAPPAWEEYLQLQEAQPDDVLRIVRRFGKLGKVTEVLAYCGEVKPRWSRCGPDHRFGGRRAQR